MYYRARLVLSIAAASGETSVKLTERAELRKIHSVGKVGAVFLKMCHAKAQSAPRSQGLFASLRLCVRNISVSDVLASVLLGLDSASVSVSG
jgi:hypothetical protein